MAGSQLYSGDQSIGIQAAWLKLRMIKTSLFFLPRVIYGLAKLFNAEVGDDLLAFFADEELVKFFGEEKTSLVPAMPGQENTAVIRGQERGLMRLQFVRAFGRVSSTRR